MLHGPSNMNCLGKRTSTSLIQRPRPSNLDFPYVQSDRVVLFVVPFHRSENGLSPPPLHYKAPTPPHIPPPPHTIAIHATDTPQSRNASQSRSSMPPEITDHVISFLWHEPGSLYSCALVCRQWYARSRFLLYSQLVIRGRRNFDNLCQLLLRNPRTTQHCRTAQELIVYDSIQSPYHHILPHLLGRHVSKISTLTLVGHGGVSETPVQRLLVDPGFLMLVPMFASVTSLVLRNYTLDSYGDLIRLIASFPQLQALSLCGLHLKSQLESPTGAPNLPSTFQRKSHALRLRTLYMYLNPQMTLSILEGLAVTQTRGSLREIEIYGSFEGYFGWSENDHRYAVHTLRSFRIGQEHRRLVLTPNNQRDNSVSFGLIYRENIPSVHRTQVEEISRWQDLWMTIKGILTDPSVKGQLHRIVIHLYLPTTLQATTQGLISLTPQSDHTPVARIGEVTSQRVFDSYTAVTIKMHCAPKYTLSSAERVAVYIKTEGAIQGQLSKWDKRHILELSRSTWNGDWSLVNFEA